MTPTSGQAVSGFSLQVDGRVYPCRSTEHCFRAHREGNKGSLRRATFGDDHLPINCLVAEYGHWAFGQPPISPSCRKMFDLFVMVVAGFATTMFRLAIKVGSKKLSRQRAASRGFRHERERSSGLPMYREARSDQHHGQLLTSLRYYTTCQLITSGGLTADA